MRSHDLDPGHTGRILDILSRLRPHDLVGAEKIRLGRDHDGGYVMLDRFDDVKAAYSIGINDDVSWDKDMVARGIPVFQYDHTIVDAPERHPLMTWRKLGLDGSTHDDMISLQDALDQNGHGDVDQLILKCDIEGFEWHVLRNISHDLLRRFEQIVMEIHAFDYFHEPDMADRIQASIKNLTSTHRVVHVHANNYARWAVVGGVPVPSVLEITLARLDMGAFRPSETVFPTPIDMPCDPSVSDLHLGRFIY